MDASGSHVITGVQLAIVFRLPISEVIDLLIDSVLYGYSFKASP